jgi:hypothetical protein
MKTQRPSRALNNAERYGAISRTITALDSLNEPSPALNSATNPDRETVRHGGIANKPIDLNAYLN